MGNNKKIFIEKAQKIHGDKYDYSKVEYTNSQTKVCIICPEHGEFWQTPANHLRNECPKCANVKRGRFGRCTKEEFIRKAREIHGWKYDYSKVEYVNSFTKVCIICPEHGEFWMIPSAHISGRQGCPKCAGKGLSNEEWITLFKKVHGDKYNYSKTDLKHRDEKGKICIICPEHGEFWITPHKHYHEQQGCPKCGNIKKGLSHRLTTEEFIEKARGIHGDKYDYSKVEYIGAKTKVCIICPKHGEFWITPNDHLMGHACGSCGIIESKGENEIYNFLCNLIGKENVVQHERNILGDNREIDIFLPEYKLGIEFNGLYWHSERKGKMKEYHLSKTLMCEEKNVSLVQIFEDEYLYHKDIIFNMLKKYLKPNEFKYVMSEQCIVKEIDRYNANIFIKENSMKKKHNAGIYLGCFYGEILIGVMCFYKSQKKGEWIISYVENKDYICNEIRRKILDFFIETKKPKKIITFVDRRFSVIEQNEVEKMGFAKKEVVEPDYTYVTNDKPTERINKYFFRKKSVQREYNLPYGLTEKQTIEKLCLNKIWDCGKYRYDFVI